MIELKSKKTNKVSIITEQELAAIIKKGVINMKKFTVTELKLRTITPPMAIKPKAKK
jgi:hypothetical protein